MQLVHFETLRLGVQRNASPASPRALAAFADTLSGLLDSTGLFTTVEVECTEDRDQLVAAMIEFRAGLPSQVVGAVVERLWEERLRFPWWEVHTTRLDDGFVEFQGATRESVAGRYLTLHLVALSAPVPVQRSSSEEREVCGSAGG